MAEAAKYGTGDAYDTPRGDDPETVLLDQPAEDSADAPDASPCTPAGQLAAVRHFFAGLVAAYTPRFTAFVALMYGLYKGMTYLAVYYSELPYYKRLGVSGSEYQKLQSVAQMAYAMKPAVGVLSDSIPLFGYHKRFYFAIACVVGAIALVGVALLPEKPSSASAAGALFFMVMFSIGATDLLTEGKYSELMRKDKTGHGASIVTWIWMVYKTGGLIAAAVEGTVAEHYGPKLVLWLLVPVPLILLGPTLRGWIPEAKAGSAAQPPLAGSDAAEARHSSLGLTVSAAAKKHRGTLLLAILLSATALVLAAVSLTIKERIIVLVTVLAMSAFLLACSFAVLPRLIAKAFLYMFLNDALMISTSGALDYFYTADAECAPDGPQFSYELYQTVGNIVSNLAGIAGTVMFQRFLSRGSFRRVFWLTTGLVVGASIFDVIIVKRWNVAIGIPDEVVYVFGDGVVSPIAAMLAFMPTVVLISRMCPKGMESTVYALLAGVSNFGKVVSSTLGYMLTDWLEIRTTAPCDFSNLPALIVIGRFVTPLLLFPLVVILIPPTNISEHCRVEEEEHSDEGLEDSPGDDDDGRFRRSTAARQSHYSEFAAADDATELEGSCRASCEQPVRCLRDDAASPPAEHSRC